MQQDGGYELEPPQVLVLSTAGKIGVRVDDTVASGLAGVGRVSIITIAVYIDRLDDHTCVS